MKIFREIWRYWKWICVALVTTTVLLLCAAWFFTVCCSMPEPDLDIRLCIESGGTWNDQTYSCEKAG